MSRAVSMVAATVGVALLLGTLAVVGAFLEPVTGVASNLGADGFTVGALDAIASVGPSVAPMMIILVLLTPIAFVLQNRA